MRRERLIRLWQAAGWTGVLAVSMVSLAPVPPETVEAAGGDKLLHLLGYAALAFWFGQLRPPAGAGRWQVAAGLTVLGAALEAAQYLVPWRSTEGWDLLADTAGAIVGTALSGWRPVRVMERLAPRP